MSFLHDVALQRLIEGVVGLLVVATAAGRVLALGADSPGAKETVQNLNRRVNAWWVMAVVFGLALLTGGIGSYVLFGLLSFLALREFVTIAPTVAVIIRRSSGLSSWSRRPSYVAHRHQVVRDVYDHDPGIRVPLYHHPHRSPLPRRHGSWSGPPPSQWALMTCVYCLSYAPALLGLELRGFAGQGAKLLLFLVIIVQLSDVAQYVFGKLFGRRRISPNVSPNKTWEGFLGGVALATLSGALIWWGDAIQPWQAGVMALIVALMGFGGGLVMSAIKRDRGVKDFAP